MTFLEGICTGHFFSPRNAEAVRLVLAVSSSDFQNLFSIHPDFVGTLELTVLKIVSRTEARLTEIPSFSICSFKLKFQAEKNAISST